MEHRHWTITVNNTTEDDMTQLMELLEKPFVDYYVVGFEGCTKHHSHLHVSVHFTSSKTMSSVLSHFTKKHHCESVKDSFKMHEYCMGYEDDKLKCKECSWYKAFEDDRITNFYLTRGDVPIKGMKKKNKSDEIAIEVMEGATIQELRIKYPGFMMMNGDKVRQWKSTYKRTNEDDYTDYYRVSTLDPINIVQDNFPGCKLAVVRTLEEFQLYDDVDTLLYLSPDTYDRVLKLYPYGYPLSYKYGYQLMPIRVKRFIIMTDDVVLGYRTII